jgi:hypothetical protein
MAGAITGTPLMAAAPTNYAGPNSQLSPAIQQIWSKEILFQAMPILRFEQFAVKKTELGVTPGLSVNFMRYNNLGPATPLVEGVRLQTNALTASQFSITVGEQGYAIAVSELLLNASFDDVMASGARLLGRNMALYLDGSARDTLYACWHPDLPAEPVRPRLPGHWSRYRCGAVRHADHGQLLLHDCGRQGRG